MEYGKTEKTVIVANGSFPSHDIALTYLKNAGRIICCDGSAENLLKAGYIPDAIVGDMDSLSAEIAEKYKSCVFRDENQDTNDLTKAVNWCIGKGYTDIVIVGATGKREDHTLGNISLLVDYAENVKVIMVTDTGTLVPLLESSDILSFAGQQISIFAINRETVISSRGLRYPLDNMKIENWWVATLNEALGDSFSLEFRGGPVIVYLKYTD